MKIIDSTVLPPKYTPTLTEQKKHMAFFDIETTGLSPQASSLYLIGILYFDESSDSWNMRQWFADDYRSEKAILIDFLEFLKDFTYLYHFNGNTFDIPYIIKKCNRHKIRIPESCKTIFEDKEDRYSIDLLKHIRKLKPLLSLEKCNQTRIEHWLGIHRTDTFSGGELIPVYSEYMQQKIIAPQNASHLEKVLLLHNHDDIQMMLAVSSLLQYENYLSTDFQTTHPVYPEGMGLLLSSENMTHLNFIMTNDQITLSLPLPECLPKKVIHHAGFPPSDHIHTDEAVIEFSKDCLKMTFPVFRGSLKLFLSNYADYYYLPEEDCAMHKSVAEFVEKSHRKKATASTCYLKKEGAFLPMLSPYSRHTAYPETNNVEQVFRYDYREKLVFVELPKKPEEALDFWKKYLQKQLRTFL